MRTNGVSIGDANLHYMAGDVNRIVPPGKRSVTWRPDKAWPGHTVDSGVTAVVTAWSTNTPPNYMVVSLQAKNTVRFYTSADALPEPGGIANDLYKTEYLVLRKIPAAKIEWRMGATNENGQAWSWNWNRKVAETPHVVSLSNDFYIGVYEVTQRQYEMLGFSNPSYFKGYKADYPTRPVESVSWVDLRGSTYVWPKDGHLVSDGFIKTLREHSGLNGFDLPTDAQYEFACRAGHGTALYDGKSVPNPGGEDSNVNKLARYYYNGGHQDGYGSDSWYADKNCTANNGTAKVGTYAQNDFGLYDMLGNVSEWTLDWYQESPLGYDVERGPETGNTSKTHVVRGGSYGEAPYAIRCAVRTDSYAGQTARTAFVGFRLCCPAGLQ